MTVLTLHLNIADASFLNNSDYTIFVLEKRESNKSDNYFIGDGSSANESSTNQNLTLGYSVDDTIKHSHSSDNKYNGSVTTYSQSQDKPRVFAFTHSKVSGKKTYVNGLLAASSSDTASLTNMTSLKIGKSYQGQLGELIIFARSLTDEERKSVEDYLGKKWTSPIIRTSNASGSCVGGIVSNTGCQIACQISVAGVSATFVADGFSGSLTCNATGYAGGRTNQTYSCSTGSLSLTPSATVCTTSGATSAGASVCASNYEVVSGNCQAVSCVVPTGIGTNTTVVNADSGSIACDATGYWGTGSTYTCSQGVFQQTGTACSNAKCIGGDTSTYTVSGETIHLFTSSGTLTCNQSVTAKVLVVGGGGGGVVENLSYSISSGNNVVTVGNGGTKSTWSPRVNATNGQNSVFGTITAYGGGAGGQYALSGAGFSGASSGGGSCDYRGTNGAATQGNIGAVSFRAGYGSSGGGGAGGAGGLGFSIDASRGAGGNGGVGLSSTITGGSPIYYGGGGGGGANTNSSAAAGGGNGGNGGGGNGATTASGNGSNATANTGGGGGGGECEADGGNGGSGVVIVRYSN